MKFTRLNIPDIVLCQPTLHTDNRGYLMETLIQHKLEDFISSDLNFCQENQTKSSRGVLRGLHYQIPPFAQNKLVRVIRGAVLDVVVDVRKTSPTFGNYISIEISEKNKKQLFIPAGFAHGFVALVDNTIFVYKTDNYYNPESERGIIFDDEYLAIDWGIKFDKLKLSQKDHKLPQFKDADYFV